MYHYILLKESNYNYIVYSNSSSALNCYQNIDTDYAAKTSDQYMYVNIYMQINNTEYLYGLLNGKHLEENEISISKNLSKMYSIKIGDMVYLYGNDEIIFKVVEFLPSLTGINDTREGVVVIGDNSQIKVTNREYVMFEIEDRGLVNEDTRTTKKNDSSKTMQSIITTVMSFSVIIFFIITLIELMFEKEKKENYITLLQWGESKSRLFSIIIGELSIKYFIQCIPVIILFFINLYFGISNLLVLLIILFSVFITILINTILYDYRIRRKYAKSNNY
jgi:hypothetical protein